MSGTMEQTALRVAAEMDNVYLRNVPAVVLQEFSRRLVAALGAQEPACYIVKEESPEGDAYGYSASYPEAVHEHINDTIQRLVDYDAEPPVMHCVPLYAAPYIKEGWQMVPKEPTLHEGRPYQKWYSRKIEECGDPQDMPSGGLNRSAPEYKP